MKKLQSTTIHVYVQGFVPQQTSTMFLVVPTAKFGRTLIMAIKRKSLDLNRRLEIIQLCEVGSS
jgi:hypothetical protein